MPAAATPPPARALRASEAFQDLGGVPPRELAAACVEALQAGCCVAPGEWIAANVPQALQPWVADYVARHVDVRTQAVVSRARAHLRVHPTRHVEIWVAENVPAYLQVGVMFALLG